MSWSPGFGTLTAADLQYQPGTPSTYTPAAPVVNVTVQGALLGSSVREVADTIHRELLRKQSSNVSLGFT